VIDYAPQFLSAEASVTGYENLLIFGKLHCIPRDELRKRVTKALDYMGLSEFGILVDPFLLMAMVVALVLVAGRLYPRVGQ